jgi:predicted nucleic acid-binding protein
MNGTKYLLDTNIILYIISGDKTLSNYLHLKDIYISVITEIEMFGFQKLTQKEEREIRELLLEFRLLPLDEAVKNEAILLRRNYNLKLPDCIIAATAITWNLTFISADKQFKQIKNLPLEIYEP